MFSESPCGLADSEIHAWVAPDSEIRRSVSAGRGCSILAAHIRTIRMLVAYLAIVRQECRTSYKIRMSRNACENRQIVQFLLIFVTRLLRNPAKIADFCAIFLHKTGLLCEFLSEQFTFWTV